MQVEINSRVKRTSGNSILAEHNYLSGCPLTDAEIPDNNPYNDTKKSVME
jgi:hypothetical protein